MLGELPEEEVLALVAKAKKKDTAGLVEAGTALVRDRAWRCHPRCLPAEELEQSGYVALLEAAKTYRVVRGAKFISYAYRCVDGAIRRANEMEGKRVKHQTLDREEDFLDDDGELLDRNEKPPGVKGLAVYDRDPTDLQSMLAILTPKQRIALELKHGEGRTFEEIAQEMGVSVRSVKNYVSEAIKRLRDRFPNEREEEDT
jgi:RNA polymerase sigma factor (sigma-70 family)